MDALKVAAVCMNAEPGEVEKNLDRIQSFVLQASTEGADIVCFPELSATGYILKSPEDVYNGLDSGSVMERLGRIAQEAHLVIIAGLIEILPGAKPYITQLIAGPAGLVGLYRKTHLWVVLGTMISTTILVGALVIGDSVRHSLRKIVFDRLGITEFALSSGDRFFQVRMAENLAESLNTAVAPLLQTRS